ncbi:unnamed protein product [Spirodela intermedia]|uniref:NADH-ubiquinone oxidoreductase chain 4 n=1 Tax=Spirodela intermedia TaxID=51605 RepID=A0A7I8JHM0_SPIIN|nr:unnamed protein product [Spirodela intermedia]CAA6669245.1 unnamed protein product [Spirodela intermedia]
MTAASQRSLRYGELLPLCLRRGRGKLGPTYPDRTPTREQAALLYVIVVCHVVSSPQHRRVPMHYVPVAFYRCQVMDRFLQPFFCVGVLYDRHKTRLARHCGGSVSTMPNLSTISFSSTLANMSSPGTRSFVGEFPILVGAFQRNSLVATLAALGMILGAAYSLWLYNRAVSGNLKPDFLHKFSYPNGREVSIFLPFIVGGATVRDGLRPGIFPA